MTSSPFTRLPQDMLQHEINIFLDAESRADFNAVLKPDERVHKKMAPNYALKHAIKTSFNAYTGIGLLADSYIEEIGGGEYRRQRAATGAEKALTRMFNLWFQPLNALAIMHQSGLKEQLLRSLESWMENDPYNVLYETLWDGGATLRLKAAEARAHVQSIPFHNHVSIAGMAF
jgi:hypothetical protein